MNALSSQDEQDAFAVHVPNPPDPIPYPQEPGKLYRVTSERVSPHFTLKTLANRYKYARVTVDLINALERVVTFFAMTQSLTRRRRTTGTAFPIAVVTGYQSLTDYHRKSGKLEIERNHTAGLAARISVKPPFRPEDVAKSVILTCEKSTSISVGRNDVIIAARQRKPVLAQHFDETAKARTNLRQGEAMVGRLRTFRDHWHGEVLANLEAQYSDLRELLVRLDPLEYKSAARTGHLDSQTDMARVLHVTHHVPKEIITELLFYSDYWTIQRAFNRLVSTDHDLSGRNRTADQAVAHIGETLCPILANARQARSRNNEVQQPRSCWEKTGSPRLNVIRANAKIDATVLAEIKNIVRRATARSRQDKRGQQGPVYGDPGPITPAPTTTVDVTGRYEREVGRRKSEFMGETLVLNQAGTHVEGVHAYVHKPPARAHLPTDAPKQKWELTADIADAPGSGTVGDKLLGHYRDPHYIWLDLEIHPSTKSSVTLRLTNTKTGKSENLQFTRTSSRSTHLNAADMNLPELLVRHELYPLLTRQLSGVTRMLHRDSHIFDKLLASYWDAAGSRKTQRTCAADLANMFHEVIDDHASGVHSNDRTLLSFYVRSALAAEPWNPEGRDALTRLDYLELMVEQELAARIPADTGPLRESLDLPFFEPDAKRFTYRVEVKADGLSPTAFGAGPSYYDGEMTVTKTAGSARWKVDDKKSFQIRAYGAGFGTPGPNSTKIAGTTEFTTPIEWLWNEFPGQGVLTVWSGGVKVPVAKVGGVAFDILIERPPKGKLHIDSGGLKKSVGPSFRTKGKPSPSVVGSVHLLWVGEPKGKATMQPTVVDIDYALKYSKRYRVFHALDEHLLTADARMIIAIMCARELPALEHPGVEILVEGFTDRLGTTEHNCELSERRAENVKQAIIDILGAKLAYPDKITIRALGEAEASKQDHDNKANPAFRGARVSIDGRPVLQLREQARARN